MFTWGRVNYMVFAYPKLGKEPRISYNNVVSYTQYHLATNGDLLGVFHPHMFFSNNGCKWRPPAPTTLLTWFLRHISLGT